MPGFGDEKAWLLIAGLAPAPHGGNRTGRVFTGDKSAQFLINALYEAGFANQPTSESIDNGLQYQGCYLTAVVKCTPPHHKPTVQEMANCNGYLLNEIALLRPKHYLALGRIAFEGFVLATKARKNTGKSLRFVHGEGYDLGELPKLWASYHPSPRNTNTGRLTKDMFIELLLRIRNDDTNLLEFREHL